MTRGTLGKWLNKELPSLKQQCGTTDMMTLFLDTLDEKERKEEQDERWRKLEGDTDKEINSWTQFSWAKKWMTPFQILVIVCAVIFFTWMAFQETPTVDSEL